MQNIPFFHSYDSSTRRLTIQGATYFPHEIFEYADDIEILDASNGALTELPDEFPLLRQLKYAFFSRNKFPRRLNVELKIKE